MLIIYLYAFQNKLHYFQCNSLQHILLPKKKIEQDFNEYSRQALKYMFLL